MRNLLLILSLFITTSVLSQVKIDSVRIAHPITKKFLKTVIKPENFIKSLDSLNKVYKTDSFLIVNYFSNGKKQVGLIIRKEKPKKEINRM